MTKVYYKGTGKVNIARLQTSFFFTPSKFYFPFQCKTVNNVKWNRKEEDDSVFDCNAKAKIFFVSQAIGKCFVNNVLDSEKMQRFRLSQINRPLRMNYKKKIIWKSLYHMEWLELGLQKKAKHMVCSQLHIYFPDMFFFFSFLILRSQFNFA